MCPFQRGNRMSVETSSLVARHGSGFGEIDSVIPPIKWRPVRGYGRAFGGDNCSDRNFDADCGQQNESGKRGHHNATNSLWGDSKWRNWPPGPPAASIYLSDHGQRLRIDWSTSHEYQLPVFSHTRHLAAPAKCREPIRGFRDCRPSAPR